MRIYEEYQGFRDAPTPRGDGEEGGPAGVDGPEDGGGARQSADTPSPEAGGKIRVFSLGGPYDYGDEVEIPEHAVTAAGP